jgi:hypothetical protein
MDDSHNDKLLATGRERNETVCDDVGQSWNNLLVCPGHAALSPGRHFAEQATGSVYSLRYSLCRARIANGNVGY